MNRHRLALSLVLALVACRGAGAAGAYGPSPRPGGYYGQSAAVGDCPGSTPTGLFVGRVPDMHCPHPGVVRCTCDSAPRTPCCACSDQPAAV